MSVRSRLPRPHSPVDRPQLEDSLERIRQRISDPRRGIHGPSTLAWEVSREQILFLGGGCAALLQLAHPAVASAIAQHSKTQVDAWGRFWRTFRNVWAMVFGDLDQAFASARRVHAIHGRVFGSYADATGPGPTQAYQAREPEALLWVYATLLDTSLKVFQLVVRKLTIEQQNAYIAESRVFGELFGIPCGLMPEDRPSLSAYMSDELKSGRIAAWPPSRQVADFLLSPPFWGSGWLVDWYRTMTAGLLPARLRRGFGLAYGPRQARRFDRSIRCIRWGVGWTPRLLRYVPAYRRALRRCS